MNSTQITTQNGTDKTASPAESAPALEESKTGLKRMRARAGRRRRNRLSFAARVMLGMCLGFLLATPVLSVSLWNPQQSAGLYQQPPKVWRNGDIITIVINENTSADHEWTTERDKQWQVGGSAAAEGVGAGTTNLFGRFFPFMNLEYQNRLQQDNKADRKTTFTATVAAEVVNVLPNGNLQIVARKVIRVNSEEQLIELTGNIRPDDVTPQNMIPSSAVADANIKVNGTLRYTNSDRPSPLERVFSFVSGLFL